MKLEEAIIDAQRRSCFRRYAIMYTLCINFAAAFGKESVVNADSLYSY